MEAIMIHKKFLAVLILLLFSVLFNTACNDSNINTKNGNNLQEWENPLVGTWVEFGTTKGILLAEYVFTETIMSGYRLNLPPRTDTAFTFYNTYKIISEDKILFNDVPDDYATFRLYEDTLLVLFFPNYTSTAWGGSNIYLVRNK